MASKLCLRGALRRHLYLGTRHSRSQFLSTSSSATSPGVGTSRSPNLFWNILLLSGVSLAAYSVGSIYPPPILTLISPRPAPAPPSDIQSPESKAYTVSLETQLHTLPLLVTHRSLPDSRDWYETRPYLNFPEERRVNNLTAGTLRGPGKLASVPLVRARKDESESLVIVHVGRGLCGHDGIVHGGLLATLLDETLARTAINNLPEKVGVTANLSINYRAPTRADQFIVIKTKLTEIQGRKAWVEGRIEDISGVVLAEAKAMFVQPKYAKLLNTAVLRQAMGEPGKDTGEPVHLADGASTVSAKAK